MDYTKVLDVEDVKERLLGNEGLYKRLLVRFSEETSVAELREAVANGNVETGFHVAHTLKGVVGNLGLKKLTATVVPVVEILRGGALPSADDMQKIDAAYAETVEAIQYVAGDNVKLF